MQRTTSFYAEYNNRGKGYTPKKRVGWSHQLSKEEREKYTEENILGGWIPEESKK